MRTAKALIRPTPMNNLRLGPTLLPALFVVELVVAALPVKDAPLVAPVTVAPAAGVVVAIEEPEPVAAGAAVKKAMQGLETLALPVMAPVAAE